MDSFLQLLDAEVEDPDEGSFPRCIVLSNKLRD